MLKTTADSLSPLLQKAFILIEGFLSWELLFLIQLAYPLFPFPLIKVMQMLPKQWNSFSLKTAFCLLKRKNASILLQILKAGSSENGLPICIYEGESLITNRNTLVCHLAITGKSIAKDLKRGSPVDITIEINESRELSGDGLSSRFRYYS